MPANAAGGVVKRFDLGQPPAVLKFLTDSGHNRLRQGEAAAGEHREDPFTRDHETVHFAADINLVDAGVGAGVRGEDEALVGPDAEAVSHEKWFLGQE